MIMIVGMGLVVTVPGLLPPRIIYLLLSKKSSACAVLLRFVFAVFTADLGWGAGTGFLTGLVELFQRGVLLEDASFCLAANLTCGDA